MYNHIHPYMCIIIYMHTYVYTYTYHIHIHIHITYMYIHIYIHSHSHSHACTYTYVSILSDPSCFSSRIDLHLSLPTPPDIPSIPPSVNHDVFECFDRGPTQFSASLVGNYGATECQQVLLAIKVLVTGCVI